MTFLRPIFYQKFSGGGPPYLPVTPPPSVNPRSATEYVYFQAVRIVFVVNDNVILNKQVYNLQHNILTSFTNVQGGKLLGLANQYICVSIKNYH